MKDNKLDHLAKICEESYANTTGIVILLNGNSIYEHYAKGFKKQDTIHIASVTKSVISILIGIAIDQGFIKSVHEKVVTFFPEYVLKRGEKTIQKITIKDLLTMSAPYKYKYEPYTKVYSSENWTKTTLDLLGGKGRIGEFKYSTIGSHILPAILVEATGQSVIEFASKFLFEPLGINTPSSKFLHNKDEHFAFLKDRYSTGWVADFQGVNTGGWGLTLNSSDMAKLGQLYLNKGIWNDELIISSSWIQESTSEHNRMGQVTYGYLWWLVEGKHGQGFAALGDGGNIIYVCPSKNLVVAITSSFKPSAKNRLELIKKHILPYI